MPKSWVSKSLKNRWLRRGYLEEFCRDGKAPVFPFFVPFVALLTRPQDGTQFAKSRCALGRGASEGVYPGRYSTERATKPQGTTALARRVAALLACGFVAPRVTERCGYALVAVRKHLVPRHKPKSRATNCVLSCGLVSSHSLARHAVRQTKLLRPPRFHGSGTGAPPVRIVQPTHGRDARATTTGARRLVPAAPAGRVAF